MDTIIGVAFDDFVIIAADKSECRGILRFTEDRIKIHKLTTHVAMAISGEAGDCDQFSNFVQANFELEKFRDDGWEVTLKRAFHWITWELAQDIRSNSPYGVFPVLGGYDFDEKRGKLYWLDYLGTGVEVSYGGHGYGESFAIGYLDRYHKPNMSKEQAIECVKGALDAIQTRVVIGQNRFQMIIADKEGIHPLPDHFVDRVKVDLGVAK